MPLTLKPIPGRYAVCRLPADAPLPAWFRPAGFCSVSWTEDELSITCDESQVPDEVRCERDWRCLMLQGPFAFDLTGVLLQVLEPLAAANIGIFAVSTFDTDYVLVKGDAFERAKQTLLANGLMLIE